MREARAGVNYDAGQMLVAMRPTVRMVVRYVKRSRGVRITTCGSFAARAKQAIHVLQKESEALGMRKWFGVSRMIEVLEQYNNVSCVARLMETLHDSKWKGVM